MHDDIFFKECVNCERQYNYSIKGVKDNYYKCRIRKLVLDNFYKGMKKCMYYKEINNG